MRKARISKKETFDCGGLAVRPSFVPVVCCLLLSSSANPPSLAVARHLPGCTLPAFCPLTHCPIACYHFSRSVVICSCRSSRVTTLRCLLSASIACCLLPASPGRLLSVVAARHVLPTLRRLLSAPVACCSLPVFRYSPFAPVARLPLPVF